MDYMNLMLADVFRRAASKWQPSEERNALDALRKALVETFEPEKAKMNQLVGVLDVLAEDAGPMQAWYLYNAGGMSPRASNLAYLIANHMYAEPDPFRRLQGVYDMTDEQIADLVEYFREF